MYIVYEHTRDKLTVPNNKCMNQYVHFGYIKDVLFFKTLSELKKYVDNKTLELIICSETPYIQTENYKFAETYLDKLENNDSALSCKFSDNYITIIKVKESNGMITENCDALSSFLYVRTKSEKFEFVSTNACTFFDKGEFFSYDARKQRSPFDCDINRTDYFSKECIIKIQNIIKELHTNSFYIENWTYKHKDTNQSFTIDDVLEYKGELIAYCRSFFGKTCLIKLSELIIL